MDRQAIRAVVLVVEDDRVISDLIAAVLEMDLGVDVTRAWDGVSGLELARRLAPDLLVLDIRLPKLSGLEIARHLKADPDSRIVPIVAISTESRAEALAAGCDEYLEKPFNLRDLTRRVLAHLCPQAPSGAGSPA